MPSKPDSFFAVLSDIHGNIDALTAVLSDIEQFPVKGMFCLGDLVGYGPEPASCVQRIMDTSAVTVLGNHEAMLLIADKIPDEDWDISIQQPIQLANEQLTKAQKSWLRSTPSPPTSIPLLSPTPRSTSLPSSSTSMNPQRLKPILQRNRHSSVSTATPMSPPSGNQIQKPPPADA
jgi:hypothetical protein